MEPGEVMSSINDVLCQFIFATLNLEARTYGIEPQRVYQSRLSLFIEMLVVWEVVHMRPIFR